MEQKTILNNQEWSELSIRSGTIRVIGNSDIRITIATNEPHDTAEGILFQGQKTIDLDIAEMKVYAKAINNNTEIIQLHGFFLNEINLENLEKALNHVVFIVNRIYESDREGTYIENDFAGVVAFSDVIGYYENGNYLYHFANVDDKTVVKLLEEMREYTNIDGIWTPTVLYGGVEVVNALPDNAKIGTLYAYVHENEDGAPGVTNLYTKVNENWVHIGSFGN